MKRAAAVLFLVALGFVAGANASWVSNAVYVSRVTGSPLLQVLDPLHRPWLGIAAEPFQVVPVTDEDEENQG